MNSFKNRETKRGLWIILLHRPLPKESDKKESSLYILPGDRLENRVWILLLPNWAAGRQALFQKWTAYVLYIDGEVHGFLSRRIQPFFVLENMQQEA